MIFEGLKDAEEMKSGIVYEPGWYSTMIDNVDLKPSKNGNSSNLSITYSILAGPLQKNGMNPEGLKITEQINFMHPDHPRYNEFKHISLGVLKKLCVRAGLNDAQLDPAIFIPEMLLEKKVKIKVVVKKPTPEKIAAGYSNDYNEIKDYDKIV